MSNIYVNDDGKLTVTKGGADTVLPFKNFDASKILYKHANVYKNGINGISASLSFPATAGTYILCIWAEWLAVNSNYPYGTGGSITIAETNVSGTNCSVVKMANNVIKVTASTDTTINININNNHIASLTAFLIHN